MAVITKVCPFSGKEYGMEFSDEVADRISRWEKDPNPPLIQVAFPDLTPDEREFILTGTHPDSWDALFGGEDE